MSGCGSAARPSAVAAPRVVVLRRAEERRKQTLARPELPLGDEVGEEHVGLGQDGSALLGPVGDDLVGGVEDPHLAVGADADKGAPDLGQPEAEGVTLSRADELDEVGGDGLPVADRRPACTAVQFMGEGGQRIDLARLASPGEAVVDPGAVGLAYLGRSRESAATTVVLISWVPESG